MTGRVIRLNRAKHNKKKIPNLSFKEKNSHIKISHMRYTIKKDRLNR